MRSYKKKKTNIIILQNIFQFCHLKMEKREDVRYSVYILFCVVCTVCFIANHMINCYYTLYQIHSSVNFPHLLKLEKRVDVHCSSWTGCAAVTSKIGLIETCWGGGGRNKTSKKICKRKKKERKKQKQKKQNKTKTTTIKKRTQKHHKKHQKSIHTYMKNTKDTQKEPK